MKMLHVIAGAACLGLLGCSIPGKHPPSDAGDLYQPVEQFSDLPVPAGLRLLTEANRSWSRSQGSFRAARLYYTGRVRMLEVQAYLRQRMPAYGWELESEEASGHQAVIQRWIKHSNPAVHYTLRADLVGRGPETDLTYDYKTRRVDLSPMHSGDAAEASSSSEKDRQN
jgi:hypothetical protein